MTQIRVHDQRIGNIEIVCHKGANAVAPENTYAAARQAIEWGADYVEVDVWTSRDGEMVILHDSTVDRTTDGSGYVVSLTTNQLSALDAGQWFSPRFAGEPIPVLREFLTWIRDRSRVFLDVKFAHPQQLLDVIYDTEMQEQCFIWSSSDLWMALVHELDPSIPLKINVASPKAVLAARETYDVHIVEVQTDKMSPALVQVCREQGIKLMINEMNRDPDAFRKAIAWEPDMINLDHADLFQKTLSEFNNNPSRREVS